MNGREAWRRSKRFVGPQYLVEPPSIEGTFEQSRILIRLLDLPPVDSELVHSRPQGTRVEAQDRCGSVFSLDTPSGFRKDFKNLISLGLFQGFRAG